MDTFLPVQWFADWLTYSVLPLQRKTLLGESVNFFVYDTIKIFLLLCTIIYVVSIIRSFFPPEKVKTFLTRKFSVVGNILAALLGIVTPFCSCSAVPLFIGFLETGVPLGVTFSFLISAPMVNEIALVLLMGLFGLKAALLYVVSGVGLAIVVGYILGKLHLEHLVEDYVWKIKAKQTATVTAPTWQQRSKDAISYTQGIVKKVFPYVLLGVALGAVVHGYAPEQLLATYAGKDNFFAVPFAVLIGVPLYSNAAGTIPIVRSLIEKGLPIGTALAFMMSVTALSFPEMIILRKVLKIKLLVIYVAILTVGIVCTGYMFNIVL
ncbi:MAG: permease [bacterium]